MRIFKRIIRQRLIERWTAEPLHNGHLGYRGKWIHVAIVARWPLWGGKGVPWHGFFPQGRGGGAAFSFLKMLTIGYDYRRQWKYLNKTETKRRGKGLKQNMRPRFTHRSLSILQTVYFPVAKSSCQGLGLLKRIFMHYHLLSKALTLMC